MTTVDGEIRLLANCVVGLGFSAAGFRRGLERHPHLVGCDAGSADFGPGFLGTGRDSKSPISVRRDLRIMIEGAHEVGCPVVIGSCGGAGARSQLLGTADIVQDILRARGIKANVALVHADLDRSLLHTAVDEGRTRPLGMFPDLTHDDVEASVNIVAMMGAGPITKALDAGADIVLAGRCADPAIYAAQAMRLGAPAHLAWHASKCIDKGYLATTEPSAGSPVLATIRADHFDVEPTKEGARCTVATVARTAMYENADPFLIRQPSGDIDVTEARYEQIGDAVRVRGSAFRPASPSVKLEGARLAGYRSILLVGMRDPRVLARLDEFLERYEGLLHRIARSLDIAQGDYRILFRSFGRNAVLGDIEPAVDHVPNEIGLVVDVVARTQEIAGAIVGRAAPTGSRLDVVGGVGSGGNFAYPFSPSSMHLGPVHEWSVWHVMDVRDESEPFSVELVEA
jgi:hypothetical protein